MSDSSSLPAKAEYPSLATTRAGGVYLFGHDVRYLMPTVPENPLIAWDLTTGQAHSLGSPPGGFRFAHPRVMVDARDRMHLVWGEFEGGAGPISGREFLDLPVVSLWTSMYDGTAGWSPPRLLFEAAPGRLRMRLFVVPMQSEDTHAPWRLSVTKGPGPRSSLGIVLIGFDSDQRAVALDVANVRAVYSSVQSHGDRVYLGFIGETFDAHGKPGPGGVHFQSSRDSGRTWQPPVTVSEGRAYEVKTLLAPDGTLYLVWRQERAGLHLAYRVVTSRDEGKTWSAPEDLDTPPLAVWFQAAVDACGTLHLVWEHRDLAENRAHIDHASWRDGWSPIEHVFTDLDVHLPTLHRTHDGRFLLAFAARRPMGSDSVPYATVMSERQHQSH